MTIHDEIVLKLTEEDEKGNSYLEQIIPSISKPINYRIEAQGTYYDNATISHRAIRPDIVLYFNERKVDSTNPYANPPIYGYAIEIENDIQWDFAASLQQIKDYFQGCARLEDESLAVTEVNLVANSRAVEMFGKDSSIADEIEEIISDIVKIKVCRNSLAAFIVDDLIDGIESVPSGVGELTKLQSYGCAYIRI
jgi:intracellular sulfur oxidation DsrE/DsrF family protein